ncbi:MAG: hypothetical protein AAGI22_08005 [Planctomycetota bacterium]
MVSLLPSFAVAALLGLAFDAGQDPVPARAEAVASTVSDDGALILRLACLPEEDVEAKYTLRIALSVDLEDLLVVERGLKPATSRWRAGRRVDYAIPLQLPDDHGLEADELVEIRVGFVAPGSGAVRPPGNASDDEIEVDDDGLRTVASFLVPPFAGAEGKARLKAAFDEAGELRRSGDVAGAWARLDRALRDARSDPTKARVRDELAKVGELEPPAISALEETVVAQRIRAEKVRVFGIEAGRMYDRGYLHGALRVLDEIGGALAESADEKVIGAVGEAERTTRRAADIRERLLTDLTPDEEAAVAELDEEHGRTEDLFDAADELAEDERYPEALACLRKLQRIHGIELYDRAQVRLEEIGELHLKNIPAEQAELVQFWIEHPCWARTAVVPSHCFLFLGPEELVRGIPAESKLRFDLAYVHLTDLFGRIPNPEGDRITVYFKELFDFGGGIGGGKIIDIGRADPYPGRPVRVDNGLLYHELTHCVDDTRPTHGGFAEGLANLGAAYAHEALDQKADSLHSFDENLKAFQRYFLDRDLEYWRIQNYGPSAGLFLHFVDEYAAVRGGHDWSPLRRFFREYRAAPVRDGREPAVMRSIAHYLVRAFGPQAFDDLAGFGFPLEESDRWLLERELVAFERGANIGEFEDRFDAYPNSMLPRDFVERRLQRASDQERLDEAAELRRELGVVMQWKTVGPFFAKRADPGAMQFPPEVEIDFEERPRSLDVGRKATTSLPWQDPWPNWRATSSHKNVKVFPSGWLRFDYKPYGDDNSAIYALTHVTVPAASDVLVHARADDDLVVFVNDRRVVSYKGRGRNFSSTLSWRGPYEEAADAIKMPARLEAGRNKVLLKIRNHGGPAGAVLALSRLDGSRLDFEQDALPPDVPGPRPAVPEPKWKRFATLDDRSYRSKARTEVGSFKAKSKAWFGTETDGAVKWRLFTVRPGFPKDSPSNLLWLKPNLTKDIDALRVDVDLEGGDSPKLVLTFQGEGEDDGLSGWNLILQPAGRNAVLARLERYDRLVYQSDRVSLEEFEDGCVLSLRYWDGWCTVMLGEVPMLDRVSIDPIPDRHRIGLATWGPRTRIRSLELSKGR